MELEAIQNALRTLGCDAWLFYDHHHRDSIAYHVLGLSVPICTRRWYYMIPSVGSPAKLVHRIESGNLDSLPGAKLEYSGWKEQHELLQKLLSGQKRVAMQYSPMNDVPYIGLVDSGTVELVRSLSMKVVSSADLVQLFEARWSSEALDSHREAGKIIHNVMAQAFRTIRESIESNTPLSEYDLQKRMLEWFKVEDMESEEPPVVAVNTHTANPHHSPDPKSSVSIHRGDFVLLDIWGKKKAPEAVYFDITWTGYVGKTAPNKYMKIFKIVQEARDAAINFIQFNLRSALPIYGWEVDDVARKIITERGYGKQIVHRTGHSIGRQVHGNGANMDNFETRDGRRIVPRTCFSIEPGIYFSEFGIRSEVNVYVEENDAVVTGERQEAVVPILANS